MPKNREQTGKVGPGNPPVESRFKPGQSGNPSGRPKGSVSVKAELQKIMDLTMKGELNPFTNEAEDMPVGRKVAINLAVKAATGDLWAIREVKDTLDGRPAQSVNVGGQGEENPVHVSNKLEVVLVRAKGSSDA